MYAAWPSAFGWKLSSTGHETPRIHSASSQAAWPTNSSMTSTHSNPARSAAAAVSAQVSYEQLLEAQSDPGNWYMYSGAYNSQRHSALASLALAETYGSAAPIVGVAVYAPLALAPPGLPLAGLLFLGLTTALLVGDLTGKTVVDLACGDRVALVFDK